MNNEKVNILQDRIQLFIRLFGGLEQNRTPCGFPINITQAHALQELSKEKTMTQQELASKLLIDKSTVSRIVESFVKKEFVSRTINPNNRRETYISLTDKGVNAHNKIAELRKNKYQKMLDGIPEEKQNDVLEALFYLTESLKQEKNT